MTIDESIQKLVSGATSEQKEASRHLILVGGEVGIQALSGVADLLNHQDIEVKSRATKVFSGVFGYLRDNRGAYDPHEHDLTPQTVDLLLLMLSLDLDSRDRSYIVRILGVPGNSQAVNPLIVELYDNERLARTEIMRSLGEIRDSRAVDHLIAAMRRERGDPYVQMCAAGALGKIGDRRAVKPLIAVFQDDGIFPLVRLIPYVTYELGPDPDCSVRFGVRSAALEALAAIRDPRAVKPLIAALRNRALHGTVLGCTLLRTLSKIGDSRAVDPLIAAFHDPRWDRTRPNSASEIREGLNPFKIDGRFEAAKALARIGHPAALDALRRALEDGTEEVQGYVTEALRNNDRI